MNRIVKKFFNFLSLFVLVVGLIVGTQLVQEVANLRGKASGVPANLVIDLATSFPDQKNSWQYLAQGGEEQGRSLAPVRDLTRALTPQYVRMDHVYDFFHVVSKNASGQMTYNWTELDGYIADIQAMGAKPFLALSYTPSAFGVKDTDMPDLGQWQALVRATIEHVSGRAGLGISNVYYEVWNEPDLFGQFKVYAPKNYLDLYRASARGAALAQNTLPYKLGGPATTALYRNWFDAMANLATKENVRMDFFSWHQYGEDINVLEQNIADITVWKERAGIQNVELFVTEHGMDSANNPAYDSTRGAINTLAAAAISADKLNGLFSFEIKDGPGPSKFWGRWGMLTHEKYGEITPKPRYRALQFLNQMTGSRINIAGNGSWVKAFGRMTPQGAKIFVINYDSEGKHVEAVPMRISGVPYPKFTVTRRDYNGQTTQIPVTATNNQFQIIQYFPANTAAIFEITPTP